MALKDALKKTIKTTTEASGDRTARRASPPKPLDMPYAGSVKADVDPDSVEGGLNAGRRRGDLALSGWHMLLSGLSGSGKGRSVFAPNIIMWGLKPVISMSTKGDLVETTIRKRAQNGPVYLMDLTGEVSEAELQGVDVTRVMCDPCKLVNTDDEAMAMSDLLQATWTVGTSSAGEAGNTDSTWEQQAKRPLAVFLRAGGALPHPMGEELVDGGGIEWVLEALDHPPLKKKDGETTDDPSQEDLVTPNWNNAYLRASTLLESKHAEALRAVMTMEPRQRDSVAINIRNAVTAWSLDAVLGDGRAVAFEPSMLEEPGATLYIVAPTRGGCASAACAIVEQSIQWWRTNVARKLPTLGLFLDELTQCAPIPALPEHIALLRGYNVRLIAGVQNTTQLKRRYKDAHEEMLTTFPSVLILPGTFEKELLEQAAWFAGAAERVTTSTDEHGKTTRSTEFTDKITASELVPRRRGEARLLIASQPGLLVDLPDISATDLLD